ncbi:MAG: aromatic amino acid transporter AroP, partial [Acinetobacter sp.]
MFPEKAFKLLMSLVVSAIVINWMVLSLTHLKFKQRMLQLKKMSIFPSIAYPLTNYICVLFMLCILVIMWMTPDMRIAVMLIPVWIACLSLAYWLKIKKN